jgi:hypothetical protein
MSEEKEMPLYSQGVIDALTESNEELQREVLRLRNSNRILRTVHRALRRQLESLYNQQELARFNDDIFKRFCEGEFDAEVGPESDGVLPEDSGEVKSVDA